MVDISFGNEPVHTFAIVSSILQRRAKFQFWPPSVVNATTLVYFQHAKSPLYFYQRPNLQWNTVKKAHLHPPQTKIENFASDALPRMKRDLGGPPKPLNISGKPRKEIALPDIAVLVTRMAVTPGRPLKKCR